LDEGAQELQNRTEREREAREVRKEVRKR
jgi:hypothetical protein